MPVVHKAGTIFPVYADSPVASSHQQSSTALRRPTSPSAARSSSNTNARKALGAKSSAQTTLGSSSTAPLVLKPSSSSSSTKAAPSGSTFSFPSKKRKTALDPSSGPVDKENDPTRPRQDVKQQQHSHQRAPSSSSGCAASYKKPVLGSNHSNQKSIGSLSKTLDTTYATSSKSSSIGSAGTRTALAPSSSGKNAALLPAHIAAAVGSSTTTEELGFAKPTLRKVKPVIVAGPGTASWDGDVSGGSITVASVGINNVKPVGLTSATQGQNNNKENVPPLREPIILAPSLPISSRAPLRSTRAPPQHPTPAPIPTTTTHTPTFTTNGPAHVRSDSELEIAAAGWGMCAFAPLPARGAGGIARSGPGDAYATPLKGSASASVRGDYTAALHGPAHLKFGGMAETGLMTGLGIAGLDLGGMSGNGLRFGGGGLRANDTNEGDEGEELLIDDETSPVISRSECNVITNRASSESASHGWTQTELGVWTAPPPPLTALQRQALAAKHAGGGGRMRRR